MARPVKDGFPVWKPHKGSIMKIKSDDFRKRKDVRDYILRKFNYKCYICGSSESLQIDHITSVYKFTLERMDPFNLNSEENLAAICQKCNSGKQPNL